MLTDPNVDSPANIDAAVSSLSRCFFSALNESRIYANAPMYICIFMCTAFTQYNSITLFVSNRKCSAKTLRISEKWCPGVSKDHRKWRLNTCTHAPERVLMDIFELLVNPVL
jgi:hypothetical protein